MAAPQQIHDLSSPIFLLTNICNLISIRLDSTNYVLWKFQFTSMLKAHKLYQFVDGTSLVPKKKINSSSSSTSEDKSVTVIENPLYDDWMTKDQALMTLINATLAPEALAYIVGCSSSK